jgi:hypothetical protein
MKRALASVRWTSPPDDHPVREMTYLEYRSKLERTP